MSASQMMPKGPPYLLPNAGTGGLPTIGLDVPITSVFLFLFLCGAVAHMTILQLNLRRGHKFIMSGLLFGFCMARITTMVMRIVWACRPTNIKVAIAAQVFVSAGVLLLFVINIIFAHRILRATHPRIGWHKASGLLLNAIIASLVLFLVALITVTVQSFYTLSKNTRRIDRDVQLVASTYFSVLAFLPIIIIAIGLSLPRNTRVDKFGTGRFRTKIAILVCSSLLLTLGAAFRTGTAYVPRPRTNPAWYHSKACFYLFNFTIEIIVVLLYVVVRVDRRFFVPNGSSGPGDYSGRSNKTTIKTEEETFDDANA